MLTRIISGAVIVAVTTFVVVCATVFKLPIVLTAFLAFVSAMAIYEIFNNTGLMKNKAIIIIGIIYEIQSIGLNCTFIICHRFYHRYLSVIIR